MKLCATVISSSPVEVRTSERPLPSASKENGMDSSLFLERELSAVVLRANEFLLFSIRL